MPGSGHSPHFLTLQPRPKFLNPKHQMALPSTGLMEERMRTHYLRLATWIMTGALAICLPAIAGGQQSRENVINRGELQIFDQWLDKHHDVRSDLSKNPNLINDPAYLNKHPHLKTYLAQHPKTQEELKENPGAFMQRERSYEQNEEKSGRPQKNEISQSELRNWDAYLDKHQDVRADLSKNPNLIDDPAYLGKHPHLRDFLEHHPNTREGLKENPKLFMNRERQYEKIEGRE